MYCHRDGQVGAQRLVGDLLDVAHLLRRQPGGPAEVEAQVAGPVVGAGLQRGGAEHLAQRGVHDVRAGVRLASADAPLGVDLGVQEVAPGRELAVDDPDLVDDQALDRPLHVEDLEPATVELDGAGVGDLPA